MKTTDNTTDYKQAWKSAEQGRWLANEEITEIKAQRDAALAALREVLDFDAEYPYPVSNTRGDEVYKRARAAIAAAQGSAQRYSPPQWVQDLEAAAAKRHAADAATQGSAQ